MGDCRQLRRRGHRRARHQGGDHGGQLPSHRDGGGQRARHPVRHAQERQARSRGDPHHSALRGEVREWGLQERRRSSWRGLERGERALLLAEDHHRQGRGDLQARVLPRGSLEAEGLAHGTLYYTRDDDHLHPRRADLWGAGVRPRPGAGAHQGQGVPESGGPLPSRRRGVLLQGRPLGHAGGAPPGGAPRRCDRVPLPADAATPSRGPHVDDGPSADG